MGELKGSSIPLEQLETMLYAAFREGRGKDARAAASVYLVRRENCYRLYFTATLEHFDKYAARIGKTVLGQEIIAQVNRVIPSTLGISTLGAFIECQDIRVISNVFKAFYGQTFTPIEGLSQKEEITKLQDPDAVTAQSL